MQAQNIDRLFTGLTFQKTTEEILTAVNRKISQIKGKIEERLGRVRTLRESYQISDAAFNDILTQMRENERKHHFVQNYSTSSTDNTGVAREVTVGAGVVNNLLTENDFIAAERQQVDRLTQIDKNLRDVRRTTTAGVSYIEPHELTFEELQFLGL